MTTSEVVFEFMLLTLIWALCIDISRRIDDKFWEQVWEARFWLLISYSLFFAYVLLETYCPIRR